MKLPESSRLAADYTKLTNQDKISIKVFFTPPRKANHFGHGSHILIFPN